MSVLKPKPVTTGKNQKTLNQSEIEANKFNGFDVTSDWLRKTHGTHLKIKRFKTTLTLSDRAFFDPLGPGVYSEAPPPPCNCKTAYAMATKFAQYSVRANSNQYRYCDVTVTCMTSL